MRWARSYKVGWQQSNRCGMTDMLLAALVGMPFRFDRNQNYNTNSSSRTFAPSHLSSRIYIWSIK